MLRKTLRRRLEDVISSEKKENQNQVIARVVQNKDNISSDIFIWISQSPSTASRMDAGEFQKTQEWCYRLISFNYS